MKFINPIVTDSPMLMRNRRLPYASPSNSTPMKLVTVVMCRSRERAAWMHARIYSRAVDKSGTPIPLAPDDARISNRGDVRPRSWTSASLPRVFLVGEPVELDVVELVADFFNLADVHRLHDVARLG